MNVVNVYALYNPESGEYHIDITTKDVNKKLKGLIVRYEDWKNGYSTDTYEYFHLFEKYGVDGIKIKCLKIVENDFETVQATLKELTHLDLKEND